MSEILVIGHRNPDTDSICSAIGYADFKQRLGMREAVAARCGETNERINFVLNYFKMPAPRFVADVSPKIRDVMQPNVVCAPPDTTVANALTMMDERNLRVLPVLNEDQTCRGLVSVFKMSKYFFPTPNRVFDSRRIFASVNNLAATLNAQILNAVAADEEEDLMLMVAAMQAESFAKRLASYPSQRIVVIVGDRTNIQTLAVRERVRVVVVTGDLPVPENVIRLARENSVCLLVSPHDSATTALLSRASICIKHMIHEHFLTFREDESLHAVEPMAAASQFQAFPVVDQSRRTIGIISKSDFLKKVDRKLILVDHNELSQAVHGAHLVEILEVVDHHRVQINTQEPILIRNEPVGSTSTIVADCFLRYGVELTPQIAGLLLAGLVSDTLNLTSPTTTARDAELLALLEKKAGVNAREFTETLFASGSVLINRPALQAITADCKEYVEEERVFSVAQIEEIGFDQFWKRKDDVKAALERYRSEKDYFFSAVLVTDVVSQCSLLLVAGPNELIDHIDYPEIKPGIWELEDVVSRKKQLLPFLTQTLKMLG